MKIGVCVPCWNRLKFTKYCVPLAIQNAGIEATWYLVDDCSEDGTGELLQKLSMGIGNAVVYRNDKNMGIARTRNMVFEQMLKDRMDIFVNMDNDLLLPPNWLRDLAEALRDSLFRAIGPWFVNDKNILNSLTKHRPLSTIISREIITCPIGGGCVLFKREIFEQGIFYPDVKANWKYQDAQHNRLMRNHGYETGLYTGVQGWLLERLVWDDMEVEKLRIRHATLNQGSLEGFEENLARKRKSVPF